MTKAAVILLECNECALELELLLSESLDGTFHLDGERLDEANWRQIDTDGHLCEDCWSKRDRLEEQNDDRIF